MLIRDTKVKNFDSNTSESDFVSNCRNKPRVCSVETRSIFETYSFSYQKIVIKDYSLNFKYWHQQFKNGFYSNNGCFFCKFPGSKLYTKLMYAGSMILFGWSSTKLVFNRNCKKPFFQIKILKKF